MKPDSQGRAGSEPEKQWEHCCKCPTWQRGVTVALVNIYAGPDCKGVCWLAEWRQLWPAQRRRSSGRSRQGKTAAVLCSIMWKLYIDNRHQVPLKKTRIYISKTALTLLFLRRQHSRSLVQETGCTVVRLSTPGGFFPLLLNGYTGQQPLVNLKYSPTSSTDFGEMQMSHRENNSQK